MSKTKKISISVKKGNEDSIDLMDAYADRCSLSRSDFIFKLFNQYHYTQLKDIEMPNQPIKLPNVEYEMLIKLSQKDKQKPEQYLINLINKLYNGRK